MKKIHIGEIVDVHLPEGCFYGRVLSIDEKEVTVEFDNAIVEGVPIEKITPM